MSLSSGLGWSSSAMRAYLASLASSCRRCRRCSSASARGPVSWMPFAAQVHSLPEGSTPASSSTRTTSGIAFWTAAMRQSYPSPSAGQVLCGLARSSSSSFTDSVRPHSAAARRAVYSKASVASMGAPCSSSSRMHDRTPSASLPAICTRSSGDTSAFASRSSRQAPTLPLSHASRNGVTTGPLAPIWHRTLTSAPASTSARAHSSLAWRLPATCTIKVLCSSGTSPETPGSVTSCASSVRLVCRTSSPNQRDCPLLRTSASSAARMGGCGSWFPAPPPGSSGGSVRKLAGRIESLRTPVGVPTCTPYRPRPSSKLRTRATRPLSSEAACRPTTVAHRPGGKLPPS
mmetsp:Transcript_23037/g.75248  ORF Transcript_23037/g.75248 Transcript_23037/m.75248 type:complete len:346 (-) Transcript_23037:180-1217(-)